MSCLFGRRNDKHFVNVNSNFAEVFLENKLFADAKNLTFKDYLFPFIGYRWILHSPLDPLYTEHLQEDQSSNNKVPPRT